MYYTADYVSPVGKILLASDGSALTGLWFYGQKYFAAGLPQKNTAAELPVFRQTAQWLDVYFSGRQPDFMPPLCLMGTPFQKQVWQMLQQIPYGSVTTYGALAAEIAKARGLHAMSARAVGSAVGRNPVSIIVPCHRVVGSNGGLTGYAGGISRKRSLLQLEGKETDDEISELRAAQATAVDSLVPSVDTLFI